MGLRLGLGLGALGHVNTTSMFRFVHSIVVARHPLTKV